MPLYNSRLSYGHEAPDRNYLAESAPAHAAALTATTLPTGGLLQFAKIKVPVLSSVTNVALFVNTAGSVLTAGQCFISLFNSASQLVATTADQAATWAGAPGLKTAAFVGGPFSLTAGNYFIGMWFNGTTGPSIARTTALATAVTNAGVATPNLLCGTADAGLTTTPPGTMGAQTGTNTFWWFGLS